MAARSAYLRQYRQNHPDAVQRYRAVARMKTEALYRLAERHPAEYQRLLEEVKREIR